MKNLSTDKNSIKPNGIFLVILCALVGYFTTFFVINSHLVDNPNPNHITHLRIANGTDSVDMKIIQQDSVILNHVSMTDKPTQHKTVNSGTLFNRNPIFIVWAQLILIMVSIAAGACPVFIWQIISLKKLFRLNGWQIVIKILFAAALCTTLIIYNSRVNGMYTPIKFIEDLTLLITPPSIIPGIVLITILLLIPIVSVIFIIVPAALNIPSAADSKTGFDEAVYLIDRLNRTLSSALQVLAIIVVFSVLTSSALSESINATFTVKGFEIFPSQACYAYGLLFASFLAIVYIPIQVFLKQRSELLKRSLASYYSNEVTKDDKWFDRLYSVVNINGSSLDNLKQAFTVLAPLLSSFLPEILKLINSK